MAKIYVTDERAFADGDAIWWYTDEKAWADTKIFWEEVKEWADIKVFFTDERAFAGWVNESHPLREKLG
jgi:hypothetical protein